MPRLFLRKPAAADVDPPTITSSNSPTVAENSVLAHTLTANATVTWSIVGGADQAECELNGSTLRWVGNGTKDFEAPDDADVNNTYVVSVRATKVANGLTTDQTITVTVTDVFEAGETEDAFLDNFGEWETSADQIARAGEYSQYMTKFNNNYAAVNVSWPGTGGATYDTLFWAVVEYIRGGRTTAAILNKGTTWWTNFKAGSGFPAMGEPYMDVGPGMLGMWYETGGAATWVNDLRSSADYASFYKTLLAGEAMSALDPDNTNFSWRIWGAMTQRLLCARIAGVTSSSGWNYQTDSRILIDWLIDQGQNADWSLRTVNRNLNCQQVFMQGLAIRTACQHYLFDDYRRTELLATINEVCQWVWSTMLDGRSTTRWRFLYIPSYHSGEGAPGGDFDGTSLADVNGFWLMPFGLLYQLTGDPIWRTRMLQLYETINDDAGVTAGRKQFEETFCHGWQVSAHQALSPAAPGYPIWTVRPAISGTLGGVLTCDAGTTTQSGGAVDQTEFEWWRWDDAQNEADGGMRFIAGATSNTFNSAGQSGNRLMCRVRKHNAVDWGSWEGSLWTAQV